MKTRLINLPVRKAPEDYVKALETVGGRIAGLTGVLAVYQLGSISNPGISDIDLLAIFEEGITCRKDPLEGLDRDSRYFFTHNVFGLSRQHITDYFRYILPGDFFRISGEPLLENHPETGSDPAVKIQVALEFLVANYIARSVEQETGLVSVRNFLLSVKAMKMDLELLQKTGGSLPELIGKVIRMRNTWFDHSFNPAGFIRVFHAVAGSLKTSVKEFLQEFPFYLSQRGTICYSRNITLTRSPDAGYDKKGLFISPFLLPAGYVRKWNKLATHFSFRLPYRDPREHPVLAERHERLQKMVQYNKQLFPFFQPPVNNLTIKS
jgi:hypothetical protein